MTEKALLPFRPYEPPPPPNVERFSNAGGNQLYALLALLEDPAKYKKRLDDLTQAREAAVKAEADAKGIVTKSAAQMAAAQALERRMQVRSAELDKREETVVDREERAVERALKLADECRSFDSTKTLWERERDVSHRQLADRAVELDRLLKQAAEDTKAAAELKATWERKMAKINDAMAG